MPLYCPCIHYMHTAAIDVALEYEPGRTQCELERDAPRACVDGCAAYEADAIAALSLDQAEHARRDAWHRFVGQGCC
jgi:hypothetical protein